MRKSRVTCPGVCYTENILRLQEGRPVNYYERIQKAIDFLEDNLENEIRAEEAAKEAYMSVSEFYRLFFAITGFQAKEYLIMRRMSLAAYDICQGMKVLDAVKYAYTSADAFSRILKKVTLQAPVPGKERTTSLEY